MRGRGDQTGGTERSSEQGAGHLITERVLLHACHRLAGSLPSPLVCACTQWCKRGTLGPRTAPLVILDVVYCTATWKWCERRLWAVTCLRTYSFTKRGRKKRANRQCCVWHKKFALWFDCAFYRTLFTTLKLITTALFMLLYFVSWPQVQCNYEWMYKVWPTLSNFTFNNSPFFTVSGVTIHEVFSTSVTFCQSFNVLIQIENWNISLEFLKMRTSGCQRRFINMSFSVCLCVTVLCQIKHAVKNCMYTTPPRNLKMADTSQHVASSSLHFVCWRLNFYPARFLVRQSRIKCGQITFRVVVVATVVISIGLSHSYCTKHRPFIRRHKRPCWIPALIFLQLVGGYLSS